VIVTIHQPDFMPWLGFFNKIAKADLWIVLDHVENNPRDAAFWCRRVRVLANGIPTWVSVPLRKPDKSGVVGVPINQMRLQRNLVRNMKKCRETIFQAYAKSPHYHDISLLVDHYFAREDDSLITCNMTFIEAIMRLLSIRTTIVYSSSLDPQGASNDLLVDLLQKVGARSYLCGNGADGYQIDSFFTSKALEVERNNFIHPTYEQGPLRTFVPGLSVIDAIAWASVDCVSHWVST
jgi:hypothetical protein